MAAWWDDQPWSARDEDKDFDGVAFYKDLALADLGDAEARAVAGLREALAELRELLDRVRALA